MKYKKEFKGTLKLKSKGKFAKKEAALQRVWSPLRCRESLIETQGTETVERERQ